MALQKCGLNRNNKNKELQPHGSLEFPCAGYESTHTNAILFPGTGMKNLKSFTSSKAV